MTLILIALVVAVTVLAAFDVHSTLRFLKAGRKEGNPIMVWLQRVLPNGWPVVRIGGAAAVALLAAFFTPAPGACLILSILCAIYLFVVLRNYGLFRYDKDNPMTMQISNVAALAACNALTALLNGGTIEIRTGNAPADVETAATGTLLATLTMGSPAFASAVDVNPGARATANTITGDAAADATGTAGWFRAKNSGGVGVIQGTCGGTLQGTTGDMQFATSALQQDAVVEMVSWTITHPE
jgi:hypothetical protein